MAYHISSGQISSGIVLENDSMFISSGGALTLTSQDEVLQLSVNRAVVVLIPPPVVSADVTTLTNGNVIVSAAFPENAQLKEYRIDGGEWQSYTEPVVMSDNGTITFRGTDNFGVYSEEEYVVNNIVQIGDRDDDDYIFIKSSFKNSKIDGKTQNGVVLEYGVNAFETLPRGDEDRYIGKKVILLDSKTVISAAYDEPGLETLYGNAAISVEKSGSFKVTESAKNRIDFTGGDNSHISLSRFATVNVSNGAAVGNITGGNSTVSETVKRTEKKGVVTETVSYSKSVAASGKVTVTGAEAGDISGYSTVTLDNGVAREVVNSNVKITKSEKYVDGELNTSTITETYSASGTATLKNDSDVESIGGFKTVKLIASTAGDIVLGSSYTSKNGVEKAVYTGTVTLESSTVDSIFEMSKVTVSKGFNTIGSYTGSAGNDTLTINKNAVLALGNVDMAGGAKDKFVNNGTLVLTGDFDRSVISGKGEIVAASGVFDDWSEITGVLNLGATAEGFRTTKHENSDDTLKKAVKWDLKSGDYTGWLGSWNGNFVDKKGNPYSVEGEDTVDYIKFTVSKKDAGMSVSVSGLDNYTLVDSKDKPLGSNLTYLAAGTYTLQLTLGENADSTSYTLALVNRL